MSTAKAAVEALLFVANRPLSLKALAEHAGLSQEETEAAVAELVADYAVAGRGLTCVCQGNDVQMATAPDVAAVVQAFLKEETTGELTKPALETLTIVAYRGPLTKAELEQIRGVNCSLILRNLQLRGLVAATGDEKAMTTTYQVTLEFIRHLGVSSVAELPDYERLRSHEALVKAADAAAK
jgi:segregation and condensation protein B